MRVGLGGRLKCSKKDITKVGTLQYQLTVWCRYGLFLLLRVPVEVGDGCSHAFEDDVGATDIKSPFAFFDGELFGERDFYLRCGARDNGALDGLFLERVDSRDENLSSISVGSKQVGFEQSPIRGI